MIFLHVIEQMKQFVPEGVVFEDSVDPAGEAAGDAAANIQEVC